MVRFLALGLVKDFELLLKLVRDGGRTPESRDQSQQLAKTSQRVQELLASLEVLQHYDPGIWNKCLPPILALDSLRTSSRIEQIIAVEGAIEGALILAKVMSGMIEPLPPTEVSYSLRPSSRIMQSAGRLNRRHEPVAAANSAARIVALSMHILPVEHRTRYSEEIRSELYDLAQMKATPAMQIYYAFRQFGRIWALRGALKRPATRPSEKLFRAMCWVLSSERRTWLFIGTVTIAALIDVVMRQGWGSAPLAAPAAWLFHSGAKWLRRRLGIMVIGDNEKDDNSSSPID